MDTRTLAGLHFRLIFCVSLDDTKKKVYGSTLFVSAFLGLIGSVFQLFVWKQYLRKHDTRHKPSSNPHVVFNLALVNAVSSLTSVILGLAVLFVHQPLEDGMISLKISSQDIYWMLPIQVLCDFGFIGSAFWTLIYLTDVCLQVYKINCVVAVYHALAWGLTTFFTVIAQVLRFTENESIRKCIPAKDIPCIVIVWISVLVLLMFLSFVALYAIDRKVKADVCLVSNAYTANQRKLVQHIRAKFVFFLVIFVTCWLSTLIGGAFIVAGYGPGLQESSSFTEAILHPLQGIFNYFIFTPLREGQNHVTYHGDRKSPLLPRGTIQQIYGTSFESSVASSIVHGANMPFVPSFHFTPCFPTDESPLLTSYRSTDTIDNYSSDDTLKIGYLLGGNDNNF